MIFPIIEYFIVRDTMILNPGKNSNLKLFTMPLEDFVFFFTYPLFTIPVVIQVERWVNGTAK